ncbi:MAG: glycosyltransferase family 2 protein [Burkholderiales bacterium]|nr:glycosyltransferase family 2 protein [Burkholderiales bacterium]
MADSDPAEPDPGLQATPEQALARARAASSPRYTPPPTPWRSVAIHGAVLALWGALFALAFTRGGLLAWSVGGAYIAYDTVLLAFVGWQARHLLRPAPARAVQAAGRPGVRVAVIVAAHNEAAVLPVTLAALLAQTEPPDEIVIADDGSGDGTAELLQARYGLAAAEPGAIGAPAAGRPTLRWLRLAHGGKARALNAALPHLRSDVVLTVDADTLLEAGAIAAVRAAFAAEPALAAVTGVITPVCGPGAAGRVFEWFQTYEYIRNFLSRYAWMQLDSLLLVSGAFAGFRREALLAVGGFDPDCLVEDYELIHRLRRHAAAQGLAWRIRVLGGAQARTEAPGGVGAFLRQRRRWFGGFLQTQYWYRAMVGDRRLGWLGTLMLPVKAVDTLQPLYGLTAFALLVYYAATGRLAILAPVAALIGAKIALDIGFHLWSVHLYRAWVGAAARARLGPALLAALVEPFSFQLLRHSGAALGWLAFASGQRHWGRQRRFGLRAGGDGAG